MRYYRRKIDNGWAIQILEVDDYNAFSDLYFVENGNGYHYGFVPRDYEVGKKVPLGFFTKHGFRRFYPSNRFIEARLSELEQEQEYFI